MHASTRTTATAALLDAALVIVFVVIGRSSHAEGITAAGVAGTAWPFLAGAGLGWLAGRVWRAPLRVGRSGVAPWLGALVGGMVLRVIAGQGTAVTFIIVAGAFLALVLFGWRGLAAAARRFRSARRHTAQPASSARSSSTL